MSRTVTRAFDLLDAVVTAAGPRTLMELADATGADKSTAQRLLGSLIERGMLIRDDVTKRYDLGPQAFAQAAAIGARSDVRAMSTPELQRLRDLTGESVSLHLRVAGRRVCVDGLESLQPVRRVIPLGESLPLHLGPSGKVILAHLPAAGDSPQLADAGLDPDKIAQVDHDCEVVRAQGFLLTDGDRTEGVRAVSAPIYDAQGVRASLTIAGPAARWTEDLASSAVAELLVSTTAISTRLGART